MKGLKDEPEFQIMKKPSRAFLVEMVEVCTKQASALFNNLKVRYAAAYSTGTRARAEAETNEKPAESTMMLRDIEAREIRDKKLVIMSENVMLKAKLLENEEKLEKLESKLINIKQNLKDLQKAKLAASLMLSHENDGMAKLSLF